jgi:hypothetical protein
VQGPGRGAGTAGEAVQGLAAGVPTRSVPRCVAGPGPSAVKVAAPAPAVRLGLELALKLHQAPDLLAVGTDVRLNVGGQLADGGQVDAEQLRAPLQRRRDRPAQVGLVPSPHRGRLPEHMFEERGGEAPFSNSHGALALLPRHPMKRPHRSQSDCQRG